MSHCLFIHDFFQDGRLDVLAEIRKLQLGGQWTKEKRAHWTKQAITCYERSKRIYPYLPQGSSYDAGRIAALKSAITARYPKLDQCSKIVVFALSGETSPSCRECRDRATWECYNKHGKVTSLCDRCKQELVRAQTAYITPDGWDWNEHEDHLLPLPVPQRTKIMQMKESELELAKRIFPLATLFACDLSNFLWPTSHLGMILELCIVLLVYRQSTNIVRFLFFLSKLIEGEDS